MIGLTFFTELIKFHVKSRIRIWRHYEKGLFHASEILREKLFMPNTYGCISIILLNSLFTRKYFASLVSWTDVFHSPPWFLQLYLSFLYVCMVNTIYLLTFVETPRQFIIAELSIRKLGSTSVLIILLALLLALMKIRAYGSKALQ